MTLNNGWLEGARKVPSPNYNKRPLNTKISLLVIHNISLPPKQFGNDYIEQFFQNCLPWTEHPYFKTIKGVEVSSHFLIKRDGEIIQFVSCLNRAWHAGCSSFDGIENCNDYAIGVELEGTDDIAYTEVQYNVLAQLRKSLQFEYPEITEKRITGHSNIAPGRKTDPGNSFDWHYFYKK